MSETEPRTPSKIPSAEKTGPLRAASRWDEIPSGSIFAGRYRIERLLARGGMSGVYLASQLPLNRPVALKVLVPIVEDADGEASFQERFRLEARTLASLNHPNIVVLYDYGETEDGRFFLAMEYVDGPRLSDVIKESGHLSLQRTLRIVLQTCAALRFAHNHGVVHRDIKLSNIMVYNGHDQQEQVKVVDFGLVKLTENDQRLTSAGMVLGSPHFIAPEQARGQQVDHRADIYAIGVTLYCMLTGKPPYSGATATATILAHLTQPVPSLSAGNPALSFPPGIESVVQRCLAKRAEDRYADMGQVIADLGSMVDGSLPGTLRADGPSGSTLMTFAMANPPAPARPRWMLPAAIGAFLLICLGAVAAVGMIRLLRPADHALSPAAEATATTSPTAPVVTPPAAPPPTPVEAAAATPEAESATAATATTPAKATEAPPATARPASTRPTSRPKAAPQPAASSTTTTTPTTTTPTTAPATTAPPEWKKNDLKNPWGN